MPTHPAPPSTSATSTLPVKQEEVPNSHDAVRPKVPPVEKGLSEEDGEKAGPSGLNSHPSASSYSAAPFIPFSGGGQRLGGPGGGAAGRSVSSSSSSSSLAAHTVAVESPKAKKAKSSHSSSTKVSCTTTRGANAPCISFQDYLDFYYQTDIHLQTSLCMLRVLHFQKSIIAQFIQQLHEIIDVYIFIFQHFSK